jgi:hypothetical protein
MVILYELSERRPRLDSKRIGIPWPAVKLCAEAEMARWLDVLLVALEALRDGVEVRH